MERQWAAENQNQKVSRRVTMVAICGCVCYRVQQDAGNRWFGFRSVLLGDDQQEGVEADGVSANDLGDAVPVCHSRQLREGNASAVS